jgi:glycosyltransferase involved in cell wall biosynthesis
MAMEAFREAFGKRTDVHLTIKAWNKSNIRVYSKGPGYSKSIVGLPHSYHNNITTVFDDMTEAQMVNLFHRNDALVYPGWGEGFGLIPLQALATGMPTICTGAWAPYERFLLPELTLSSRLVDSPWPSVHMGHMFEPSYSDVVDAYKQIDENYERMQGRSFRNSFAIHDEYDWTQLTKNSFERIVQKFG